jgi:hypothetical protein
MIFPSFDELMRQIVLSIIPFKTLSILRSTNPYLVFSCDNKVGELMTPRLPNAQWRRVPGILAAMAQNGWLQVGGGQSLYGAALHYGQQWLDWVSYQQWCLPNLGIYKHFH